MQVSVLIETIFVLMGVNMNWASNILDHEQGIYRSINGAADESIFIGRATKAGYYLFFKVWRDMHYDAVLEYGKCLYRIEVKGSSGQTFNVTRGSRSGAQIDREAEDRTRIISREDCDFVVGVNGTNGDCYIIPVDIIEIYGRQNLSLTAVRCFREKWDIFKGGRLGGSNRVLNIIQKGLMDRPFDRLEGLERRLNIMPLEPAYQPPGTRGLEVSDERQLKIINIWTHLSGLNEQGNE